MAGAESDGAGRRYGYDWIVVGSGFGGSVSPLRPAEKGHRVCVLEAGRRFEDEDFAKSAWRFRRFLWFPIVGKRGIMRIYLLGSRRPTRPRSESPRRSTASRRATCPKRSSTLASAHILGGAVIAPDPEGGVVDLRQHVFGYENLLVCDGSVVPANPGINPSLTITALAEHAMTFVPAAEGAPQRTVASGDEEVVEATDPTAGEPARRGRSRRPWASQFVDIHRRGDAARHPS